MVVNVLLLLLLWSNLVAVANAEEEETYWNSSAVSQFIGGELNNFGFSVAVSENYALVGGLPGAAIYKKISIGGKWNTTPHAVLTSGTTDRYGISVAITDQYAFVGDDDGNTVYVYGNDGQGFNTTPIRVWNGSEFSNVAPREKRNFGLSVSVAPSGNYAIVGSHVSSEGFIFARSAATGFWDVDPVLHLDFPSFEGFGASVSITDSFALVGATWYGSDGHCEVFWFGNNIGRDQGASYWNSTPIAVTNGYNAYSRFGISVRLSSDNSYAIVGARESSKAFIFGRDQGGTGAWMSHQAVAEFTGIGGKRFGDAVAIYNGCAAVGEYLSSTLYIYCFMNGGWNEEPVTVLSGEGYFGRSVAMGSPSLLLVGAEKSREAFVFESQEVAAPTGQPSSVPSATPTFAYDPREYISGALFDKKSLDGGLGFRYHSEHDFIKVGHKRTYYLTLEVWDSGFGPADSGQFVEFYINDQVVKVDGSLLRCAPIASYDDVACKGRFITCAYNIDVTNMVLAVKGGTLSVRMVSHGVISSSCPYNDYTVFVKYTLSGTPVLTPGPTSVPSSAPTKDESKVTNVNGLTLDIDALSVWTVLQIAAAVGVILAMGGVGLNKVKEKSKDAFQHPLPYVMLTLGALGIEIVSMVFLIVNLFVYGQSTASGWIMILLRVVDALICTIILLGIFNPSRLAYLPEPLRGSLNISSYLDNDHYTAESKLYTVIALLCFIDLGFFVHLPWRSSRFAHLSKGFPNMAVWRLVQGSVAVAAVVSFIVQVIYLASSDAFDPQRDLVFVINIIAMAVKVTIISIDFIFKNKAIATASTAIEEDIAKRATRESTASSITDKEGIEMKWQENPLHPKNNIEEQSEPLLTRIQSMEESITILQQAVFRSDDTQKG